jgi:predicted nucleic acid-binding protein
MSLVYWDTVLFIYWLEDHPVYAPQVQAIHERMMKRQDTLCTSVFALGEVLVGPYKRQQAERAEKIRDYFTSSRVDLLPFTTATAQRYAQIRAGYPVSPADAIHLASAAEASVDLFLSNDKDLHALVIPGINFIAGLDLKLA